jgi:hypothetical protein
VPKLCESKLLIDSEKPLTFAPKHRGLMPINLFRLDCEGGLWMLSTKKKWKPRYFVLPQTGVEL